MAEMHGREIPRERWQPFFDNISSNLRGKGVDITISSKEQEMHQSTLWQLNGVSYDPHDDALIVSCRQQEHVIQSPQVISIEGEGIALTRLDVRTAGGAQEVVRFMTPLLLQAS